MTTLAGAIRPLTSYRTKVVLIMVLVASFTLPTYAQEVLWKELNDKATLLYQQGRYSEAVSVAEEALKVAEETFGPGHNVATSLNILATLYQTQGKYVEAEPLYKQAISIFEKTLGRDHPNVAHLLNNLASIYQDQGKYAEAEPLYKRSLEVIKKALGKDHPDVAAVLENIAELYKKIGKEETIRSQSKGEHYIQSKIQSRKNILYKIGSNIRLLNPSDTMVAIYKDESLNNITIIFANGISGKITDIKTFPDKHIIYKVQVILKDGSEYTGWVSEHVISN